MTPRKTPPDDAILTRIADRIVAVAVGRDADAIGADGSVAGGRSGIIAVLADRAQRRLDPTRCWSCGVSLLAPGDGHAAGCRRWGV